MAHDVPGCLKVKIRAIAPLALPPACWYVAPDGVAQASVVWPDAAAIGRSTAGIAACGVRQVRKLIRRLERVGQSGGHDGGGNHHPTLAAASYHVL